MDEPTLLAADPSVSIEDTLDSEELADALEDLLENPTPNGVNIPGLIADMKRLYAEAGRDFVVVRTVPTGTTPTLIIADDRPEAQGGEGGLWAMIAYALYQPVNADDLPVGDPRVGWHVVEPSTGLDLRILSWIGEDE